MTVISGKNSVPLLRYPEDTPIRNIKEAVPYLTVDPTWEEFVPFRIYRGAEAVMGAYNAFDTKSFEPIGYKIPSGLEPQTYLFQNADINREYIVIASIDGETYCFGVKFQAETEAVSTEPAIKQEPLPGSVKLQKIKQEAEALLEALEKEKQEAEAMLNLKKGTGALP